MTSSEVPLPGGADDLQMSAKRLDTILQPNQPGAPDRVGATDSVVTDRQIQVHIVGVDTDVDLGGLGVLAGVGQRLGDYVEGGNLDSIGQPSARSTCQN